MKTNPPRNIFELHKNLLVNQQFSKFETVAKTTTPTHIDKEEVMKVVRSLNNKEAADLNRFRNEVIKYGGDDVIYN